MSGRTWRDLAPCGTDAAYQRHRYAKQPIDDACRQAHTQDMIKRRNLKYAARLGITPQQWNSMTEDQQDDALYAAHIRPVRNRDIRTGRYVSI